MRGLHVGGAHGIITAMPRPPAAPAYPAPLGPGSRIAVTAPSSGVARVHHARLDLALAGLQRRGFIVEQGRCLRDECVSASAPADERAAELMHYLLRDDIAAIVPPWGGERAIDLGQGKGQERRATRVHVDGRARVRSIGCRRQRCLPSLSGRMAHQAALPTQAST